MRIVESKTYIALPPGDTIQEIMDERGITSSQLTADMGESEAFVHQLLDGDIELTEQVAQNIEKAADIPAYFLLNLEHLYREKLVMVAEENAQEAERKAKTEKVSSGVQPALAASG